MSNSETIRISDTMKLEVHSDNVIEFIHEIEGKKYSNTLSNKTDINRLKQVLKVITFQLHTSEQALKKILLSEQEWMPRILYITDNDKWKRLNSLKGSLLAAYHEINSLNNNKEVKTEKIIPIKTKSKYKTTKQKLR